jgi:Flavin containing amine oxidoreductase
MWDVVGDAMKYSNKHAGSDDIPAEQSLMDYFKQQVPLRIPGRYIRHQSADSEQTEEDDVRNRRETVLQMAELWGTYIGSSTDRQSLRFLWLEECLDGENLFCAGTYQKVLEAIAEPAKKGADLRFGCNVTRIVSGNGDGHGQVLVTVQGGEEFRFDEVVVTMPLGCLKMNKAMFEPPLPANFEQAIDELGYGNLDKVRFGVSLRYTSNRCLQVYISFPAPFWDGPPIPNGVATQKEPIPSAPIAVAHSALPIPNHAKPDSLPERTPYSESTTFLAASRTATAPPPSSTQQALTLSTLPPPNGHPTLLFYTTATTSTHISTLLATTPSQPTPTTLLPFFTRYISLLPYYDRSSPACHPTAILATNWLADPLAGCGSYTFFPAGLTQGHELVQRLRRGMPERRVWFAGEHTAPFVALGTVTGAWWSGEGVAGRILGGEEM